MSSNRRAILRLTGIGVTTAVAGCIGGNDPENEHGNGDGNETDRDHSTIESSDTIPFVTHTTRSWWDEGSTIGRVVLIGDSERQTAVVDRFDPSESDRARVREFLSDVEYTHERVLLIESVGPNACYDTLVIESLRVENGELRGDATVTDSTDGSMACAEVITFPSSLARVVFDGNPSDAATVEITNGWGETATVRAEADDPIGPDLESVDGAIRP